MRIYIEFLLAIWTPFATCFDTENVANQDSRNVFDALIAKVAALETTTAQLVESVSSLESKNQRQAVIIQELRDRLSKDECRIQVLENVANEVHDTGPEKTEHDTSPEDTLVQIYDKRNTAVKDKNRVNFPRKKEPAKTASVDLERENRLLLAENGPVAFFATIQHDVTNLGVHQAIIFDNVVTNLGSAYHPSHGNFIAPYRGLYMFAASVTSNNGIFLYIHYMRNGNKVAQTVAKDANMASHTILLVLNAGDDVFLAFQGVLGSGILGDHFSSFAGQLITTL